LQKIRNKDESSAFGLQWTNRLLWPSQYPWWATSGKHIKQAYAEPNLKLITDNAGVKSLKKFEEEVYQCFAAKCWIGAIKAKANHVQIAHIK